MDFAWGHSERIAGTSVQTNIDVRLYKINVRDRSEIDHVLVGTHLRLLKSCRVYRSVQFDSDQS